MKFFTRDILGIYLQPTGTDGRLSNSITTPDISYSKVRYHRIRIVSCISADRASNPGGKVVLL